MKRFLSIIISLILFISAFELCGTTAKAADVNPYLGTVWITDFIQFEGETTQYHIGDVVDYGAGPVTLTRDTINIVFDSSELKYTVHSNAGLEDGSVGEYTYENGTFHDEGLLWYDGVGLQLDITGTWRLKKETPTPDPSPTPAGPPSPAHTHNFQWQTITEPTKDADGLEGEVCTICGATRNTQSLSAYGYALNDYAIPMINAAKSGQTITFEFGEWNSFPKSFMEKLVEKNGQNVTFVFHYKWNHVKQEITIPAGTPIDLNFDWYGPAKMAELYGMY